MIIRPLRIRSIYRGITALLMGIWLASQIGLVCYHPSVSVHQATHPETHQCCGMSVCCCTPSQCACLVSHSSGEDHTLQWMSPDCLPGAKASVANPVSDIIFVRAGHPADMALPWRHITTYTQRLLPKVLHFPVFHPPTIS